MNATIRRLPGFAIAAVAMALSASLVFAGQPAGTGRSNAASHTGKTVPVRLDTSGPEGAVEDTDTEEPDATEPDTTDPTTESDSSDHCNVDLTQDPSVLMTLNHGSVVCSAAHATSWDTTLYPTKGAWVSHWAKMNHGHDPNKQHGHGGG